MMFVAIAHGGPDGSYSLSIPDAPGCFTAGDTLEETIANATEAMTGFFQDMPIPRPRTLDEVIADPQARADAQGGMFLLVSFPEPPRSLERVSVSVAPDVARVLDRQAGETGMSRDALLDKAAREVFGATIVSA